MRKKSSKLGQFERGYLILQYLKKHTDKDNTVEQRDLRDMNAIPNLLGSRETYNSLIYAMAHMLNCDHDNSDRILPKEEWQLVFDQYLKDYSPDPTPEDEVTDNENEATNCEIEEDDTTAPLRIRKLYYQHIFSYEEIDALIEGIQFSKTLGKDSRNKIIYKIKKHLTSKFYNDHLSNIEGICEPIIVDREIVQNNLKIIRDAISENKKITFRTNKLTKDKKLVPYGKAPTVNPYYLVANSGWYFLVGAWDIGWNKTPKMCIYRIDMISDVTILSEKRLPKRDVPGLPLTWSKDITLAHLNMSYDNPERIKLKILNNKTGWRLLRDNFGENFEVWRDNQAFVTCSPYAMVKWALENSDCIEVLEPEHVRNKIKKQICKLVDMYKVFGYDTKKE